MSPPAPLTFTINDSRRRTLAVCLVSGLLVGVTLGGLVAEVANPDGSGPFFALVGGACLTLVVAAINAFSSLGLQRRLNQAALAAAGQPMTELPVPAKVVNYRSGAATDAPGCAIIQWTVLPADGPPRRAVSVTPWPRPLNPTFAKGTVHGVRLSALSPDLCVLDQGLDPAWRAQAGADPRWAGKLPTASTVAGLALAIPLALAVMAIAGTVAFLLLR